MASSSDKIKRERKKRRKRGELLRWARVKGIDLVL